MQPVRRNIADQFAERFAGIKIGFSGKEITDYFRRYSLAVRAYEHYGFKPKRSDLFVESLYTLSPKLQYCALHKLTVSEIQSRYDYPTKNERNRLSQLLHNSVSPTPIGLRFSSLSDSAFREDWATCQSRLSVDPASAITAARTMLETLLKTIVDERGETPDASNFGRLFKQARSLVLLTNAESQKESQLLSGLISVVSALAGLSNSAGDRHGTIGGLAIDDPRLAELCINSAGTLGIAMLELHLFQEAP
ncbi:MAG: abortive infection family protein [Pseudomonadota bacterium]